MKTMRMTRTRPNKSGDGTEEARPCVLRMRELLAFLGLHIQRRVTQSSSSDVMEEESVVVVWFVLVTPRTDSIRYIR